MNHTIFFALHNLAHQSVFLDWLIVFSSNLFGYIMIGLAIVFLFFHEDGIFNYQKLFSQLKNKIKEIFFILSSGVLAWVIATILKYFISSPRPFLYFENVKPLFLHGGFDSFPSGHATFFSALAIGLFLRYRRIGLLYIIVAIIISLARVAAGVHFPIDILAGWILGTIISLIFNHVFQNKVS